VKKIPKEHRKKIIKFFNLDNSGPKHYRRQVQPNDKATLIMIAEASKATEYLVSFSAMYHYNANARSVINRIASKVRDPQGKYSTVYKMKIAHIYARYVNGYQRMDNDGKKGERVLTAEERKFEETENSRQNIGMMEYEWKTFFQNIPDGDIIVPQVELFLKEIDPTSEQVIRLDAQLDEDRCNYIPYRAIRTVKETIFDSGEWINGDFMSVSSLNKLKAAQIRELCKTWKAYAETFEWTSAEHFEKQQVLFLSEGYREVEIPVFNPKAKFKDEFEMMFFTSLMEYFLKNEPDFRYHGKLLSKYDFVEFLQ
jgi:hypothetical protein